MCLAVRLAAISALLLACAHAPEVSVTERLDALEYPYCNVVVHEASPGASGHVSADGCDLYWNPDSGPQRFGELIEEAIRIRERNLRIDPELYGKPRALP